MYELKTTTILKIQELKALNWFSSIGEYQLEAVSRVYSWQEAVDLLDKEDEWGSYCYGNFVLNLQNEVSRAKAFFETGSFRPYESNWNECVESAREHTTAMRKDVIEPKLKEFGSPSIAAPASIIESLSVSFLMAVESLPRIDNLYISKIYKYWADGHFPCGWRGEYPDGELVVF